MPEGVECLVVAENLKQWFLSRSQNNKPRLYLRELMNPTITRFSPIDFTKFNDYFGEIDLDRISTFGKNIFVPSHTGYCLIVQLGMTGTFTEDKDSHSRINFAVKYKNTDIDIDLYYNDIRKFGRLYLAKSDQLPPRIDHQIKKSVDWRDPKAPGLVWRNIRNTRRILYKEIKAYLLDQDLIAGIGNIYACEALFAAGIHPKTTSRRLNKVEIRNIIFSAQNIMKESYKSGGMTVNNFKIFGKKGNGKNLLKVYGKEGLPCIRCQCSTIQRIIINGRSTFFCPTCQREKENVKEEN
jgi:formamidopyrimidine-DNA glycosylase